MGITNRKVCNAFFSTSKTKFLEKIILLKHDRKGGVAMMLSNQEIGKRIKTAREAFHLTQMKFASRIHLEKGAR